ncbi:MAG: TIGR03435 family protein [Terracidiphilus sp.]
MRLHCSRHLAAVLLIALLSSSVTIHMWAQTGEAIPQETSAKIPAYEIVSIKRADPGDRNAGWETLPNGFDFKNTSLFWLIYSAYAILLDSQISGLPEWAKTDKYNVSARVDEETVEAWKKLSKGELRKQQQLMLQALFADRFQLKMRRQVKELPVYDLVIAKGGLKMKEAAPDEKGYTMQKQTAFYGGANEGEYTITDTTRAGTVLGLAQILASSAGRIVEDKTGLGDKTFDYELKWSSSGQAPQDGGDAGATLFKALEEELGLKLVPAKEPVDTFVVEHMERPSAN